VGSRAAPWALPPVPHVPLVLELLCGGVAVGSPVGGAGAGAPALRPEDGDQVAAAERGEDLIGINGLRQKGVPDGLGLRPRRRLAALGRGGSSGGGGDHRCCGGGRGVGRYRRGRLEGRVLLGGRSVGLELLALRPGALRGGVGGGGRICGHRRDWGRGCGLGRRPEGARGRTGGIREVHKGRGSGEAIGGPLGRQGH